MTETQIQAWLELGVTRLSLGVQSFHDDTLAWMNRAHTGIQAEQAIRLAHDLGVKAMTLDLIYGVPTARDWNDDIARATALPIQHLSAYALTVEPGTVLGTRIERGAEQPAPVARTAEEYHRLCHALAAQGWSHYETSNWAAPQNDGWWVQPSSSCQLQRSCSGACQHNSSPGSNEPSSKPLVATRC